MISELKVKLLHFFGDKYYNDAKKYYLHYIVGLHCHKLRILDVSFTGTVFNF
jgi:hypothetical protein